MQHDKATLIICITYASAYIYVCVSVCIISTQYGALNYQEIATVQKD